MSLDVSMEDLERSFAILEVAFNSLGRALICLDKDFRMVHATPSLEDLVGPGAFQDLVGEPVQDLLGVDLFGPQGAMREALEGGERREGWRGTIRRSDGSNRLVSVTVVPVVHVRGAVCDPRVTYFVVLRPDEEEVEVHGRGPTVFSGLVARSAAMLRIFELIRHLSHSEATVLITGESGTGKGVLAKAIHEHSPRRKGPFVAVNCGALPGELLESELFGHVKGAFTGAIRDRAGRFEVAQGGTLFLDEVGEMPGALQVRLLRVLQDGAYERVGESNTRFADVRVVTATNRNLPREILEGRFREDLFYRLRVVPIEIPPLRHRREDVEPLAKVLLSRIGQRQNRAIRFSPAAMKALLPYPWPGNVRELENALEYAVAICHGQTLTPAHLPYEVVDFRESAAELRPAPSMPAEISTAPEEDFSERSRIEKALRAHRWRRSKAASALGISRTTLWRKMKELGLENP